MAEDIRNAQQGRVETTGKDAPAPFDWLRQEVDHLFDEFFHHQQRRLFTWPANGFARVPSIDLEDRASEFRLTAEMPGFEIKDIELEMRDGSLHITAAHENTKEERGENMLVCERHSGRIERLIALPQAVDIAKAKATLRSGILTVNLPKKEVVGPEAHRIAIGS